MTHRRGSPQWPPPRTVAFLLAPPCVAPDGEHGAICHALTARRPCTPIKALVCAQPPGGGRRHRPEGTEPRPWGALARERPERGRSLQTASSRFGPPVCSPSSEVPRGCASAGGPPRPVPSRGACPPPGLSSLSCTPITLGFDSAKRGCSVLASVLLPRKPGRSFSWSCQTRSLLPDPAVRRDTSSPLRPPSGRMRSTGFVFRGCRCPGVGLLTTVPARALGASLSRLPAAAMESSPARRILLLLQHPFLPLQGVRDKPRGGHWEPSGSAGPGLCRPAPHALEDTPPLPARIS